MGLLRDDPLGSKSIDAVKPSDAKEWAIRMREKGFSFQSISNYKRSLRAAFFIAIEDDCIRKNPFSFALNKVLEDDRDEKTTITVDGYTNFLFLKKDGTPQVGMNYNAVIMDLVKKYNKHHREQLPNITPHSLRHTFCTRMANAGMNPKALQYIMGHANIIMTLDYYTHIDACSVKAEMEQLVA